MKTSIIIIFSLVVFDLSAQLHLEPKYVGHTSEELKSCPTVTRKELGSYNQAFQDFLADVAERNRIPSHYKTYDISLKFLHEMLNYVVNNSEVASYRIFSDSTHHNLHYIIYLEDQEGFVYDIMLYSTNRKGYIEFKLPRVLCEMIRSDTDEDVHFIQNKASTTFNWEINRKLVNIIHEPRHWDFVMDDGSRMSFRFCHRKNNDKTYTYTTGDNHDGYSLYAMLDTSDNGWRSHNATSENFTCNHEHKACIFTEDSELKAVEICNH